MGLLTTNVPAGPVPIELTGDLRHPDFLLSCPALPVRLEQSVEIADLAEMLGLESSRIRGDIFKPQAYSAGVPFFCIPLADPAAVQQDKVEKTLWAALLKDAPTPHVCIFSFGGAGSVHARMFAPGVGIDEDPATGAAAAALGGYLAATAHHKAGRAQYVIHQGAALGRPSQRQLAIEFSGGRLRAVKIGGQSVTYAQGRILRRVIDRLDGQ